MNKKQFEKLTRLSQKLRDTRAAKKLNLEAVSHSLKMRIPIIKAMEASRWGDLPGGVYLKGFLTKYTEYLGLNVDELVKPIFEDSTDSQQAEDEPETSTDVYDNQNRVRWAFIGVGALLFLGVIKIFSNKPDSNLASKEVMVKTQTDVDSILINGSGAEPIAKVVEHQLDLFSPHPLWVRLQSDVDSFEGFIPENATWTWKSTGIFSVRLGHTKDTRVRFDGQVVKLTEDQKRITLPSEN